MKAIIFLGVLLSIGISTATGFTQSFRNGSFEQPGGLPANGVIGFPLGDTRVTGWTIGGIGAGVSYLRDAAASVLPADGAYHLLFNGGNTTAGTWIEQTFSTVAGTNYTIGFNVSKLGSASAEMSLTVKVRSSTGSELALLKAAPVAQVYERKYLTFTATSSTTAIQFLDTSLATIAVDVLLDGVTLEQTTSPVILSNPENQIVLEGANVSISVVATGTAPLIYTWKKNGSNLVNSARISGSNATLTIFGVSQADAAQYSVQVSNVLGSVLSGAAQITVVQPPSIVTQPVSQNVFAGAEVSFNVTATGTAPLSYQWRFNNLPISGATDSSFTILPVQLKHFGNYDVLVSNPHASTASTLASLSVQVIASDFNGDGQGDILWQHKSGAVEVWWMHGTNVLGSSSLGKLPGKEWRIVTQSDLNKDGISDIISQTGNGAVGVWLMDGTNVIQTLVLRNNEPVTKGWRLVGSADFNKDDSSDLLFQNLDGRLALWFLDGTNFVSTAPLRGNYKGMSGWKTVGLIDFDDDGQKDILWQNASASLAVWLMDGTSFISAVTINNGEPVGDGWRVAGGADFNDDQETDLLFQHSTGSAQVWFMNGTVPVGDSQLSAERQAGSGWKIVGPN